MKNNFLAKEKIQEQLAWGLYFFINIIFCIKYNPIDAIKPFYLLVAYPTIVLLVYKFAKYKDIREKKIFFAAIASCILLLSVFLMIYIDKYSIEVDRWSALEYWSENLKNGEFPYGSKTHRGHYASPYPVWQLFHFPFYLLGDTGYGQIFCLSIFLIFIYRIRNYVNSGAFILLLAMSPSFWWEMAVRSDSLSNMFLAFIFLSLLFYKPLLWDKHKYWIGLIVGLFLCTKMLVVIPLFLYFFRKFLSIKTVKEKFFFISVILIGLIVPFLPFVFGEKSILNNPYNPILVQVHDGNILTFLVGVVVVVWASFQWKSMKNCYFYCAILLFLLIFSVGLKTTFGTNIHHTLFEDGLDISYFTTSIPYILFCISEFRKNTQKENI